MSTMPPTPTPTLAPVPGSKPPAWPMVIGIIAIVFGALATLQGGLGAIMSLLIEPLVGMMQKAMPEGQPTGLEGLVANTGWMALSGVAGMLIALVLLFGGINLARRRPKARKLCLTWAVLKMAYAVPYNILQYRINQAQLEAVQNDPNIPGAALVNVVEMAGQMTVVFVMLWLWALPVFLIIWFSRPRIRAEMASWPPEGAPASYPVPAPPVAPVSMDDRPDSME